MLIATTPQQIQQSGLAAALQRCLRPAVGFAHPRDVLKDPDLSHDEKRAVLASWASDASAVQDRPQLRWLLGTPEPVPLADVREALARLDRWEGAAA
jgi:hypothetical protein